jgi:hypothetical protein
MVGRGGLEPPTSRLSGVRSNHLSYRPASRFRQSRNAAVQWTDARRSAEARKGRGERNTRIPHSSPCRPLRGKTRPMERLEACAERRKPRGGQTAVQEQGAAPKAPKIQRKRHSGCLLHPALSLEGI